MQNILYRENRKKIRRGDKNESWEKTEDKAYHNRP